ncbi:MAG: bifunctional phosphoribosylaminoimidazolecarboxamide formyltransferase/IMP cyclohydrolase [Puniceicoccales bacterium]|jgi:phosphoribosylaminoimidazolecarboxamide formyltransferase/IMP cyclohydrolase|nr:bifunctional phosphoribosylaminoimidazolecarboxamide formyltransferase/IMP cyclohydrolase [Puniceicoccales bacterium]
MPRYALLSVSDKTGLAPFARTLVEKHGYTLLSTGGTAKLLRENAIPVTDVSEHTGSPEIMEGRVKTLHPKIHGGLLCRRDSAEHLAQAAQHGIALIDIVVVNLYPFETTVAKPGCSFADAVENIDIGGPSMLRSAAKNHAAVAVVTDPADYDRVLAALDAPEALPALRRELALKVFHRTAAYDAAIANYLETQRPAEEDATAAATPRQLNLNLPLAQTLRYGENPHQRASLHGSFHDAFSQLQGKELSYNNILDITAAARLIAEFAKPTLAILKHTNPCGAATAPTLLEAWHRAFETDKQAPFGGIIIANRAVDAPLAAAIAEIFSEVIIAPAFEEGALEIFKKKKNLRLMVSRLPNNGTPLPLPPEVRSVIGGVLRQEADNLPVTRESYRVVTKRQPTEAEWDSLLFGWRVVRHVKSNAIVYAGDERTLGVGAGQMSRVDSSRIAVWKAGEAGLPLQGSIVASDAFFPFPDGLLAAADAGAVAAIQPGGSMRDDAVIAAADARNMAMVFTAARHFRH